MQATCKSIVIASLALTLGAGLGSIWAGESQAGKPARDPYQRLDNFAQVLSVVEQNYVDESDRNAMIDGAIRGMIRALDPHSSFMSAEERKSFELRTSGQFVGIGIEVGIRGDSLRIISAIHGGPAQRAGIESGDIILAVDDKDVSQLSLDALVLLLRGEPDSVVKLTVQHTHQLTPQTYSVIRAIVKTELVSSLWLDGNYGYVRLKSFGTGSADEVKREIEKLNAYSAGGLRGLVLDLRDNPGGYLAEGIGLSRLFLRSGRIVSTKGRDGVVIQSYHAASPSFAFDMPLAVLIDEGSASAAEIVAGALQDHRRAVIVGMPSFGKASVQNIFTLGDGSSLKLTIAKYYTPNDRSIQAVGITPDVIVEAYELKAPNKRQNIREKDLDQALKATPAPADEKSPAPETSLPPLLGQVDVGITDLQLFVAIQQLRAREFINTP